MLSAQLLDAGRYFVHLATLLVPLFVAASFLVGLIKEYLPAGRVESRLRRYDQGVGNVVAAGLGAVTPFCSCSTIPVVAGLLGAGAPLGVTFSFLLASPLVNWVAILLLLGIFGPSVTAFYVVATLLAAIVGGMLVGRWDLDTHVRDVTMATDGGTACGCTPRTGHRDRLQAAGRGAVTFLLDTLPYLLVGLVIASLLHGVVPASWIQTLLGPANPVAVPTAAIVGAPVYISLSGMLPIAAALASHGIAIGTVLAFVIGGAGVSVPNLVLLNALFDRRLLALYATSVVLVGISVGMTFNALVG